MRLFHSASIFCCYICTCICCLKLHQVGEFFLNSIWWGPLSSNVFTICAVYWSLGRRGYFGVSNVVLVFSENSNLTLFNLWTLFLSIAIKIAFGPHTLRCIDRYSQCIYSFYWRNVTLTLSIGFALYSQSHDIVEHNPKSSIVTYLGSLQWCCPSISGGPNSGQSRPKQLHLWLKCICKRNQSIGIWHLQS